MPRRSIRPSLTGRAVAALVASLALVASSWLPVSGAPPGADARGPAGPTASPSVLFQGTYLRGFDLAWGPGGAVAVWASSDRRISACRLQTLGGGGCASAPSSIDALGDPDGVEVALDAAGAPTAIWRYDTPASVGGPMGAKLAKATIDPSGVISPAQVVADAPSFGELYSVTRAPDGRIWAVVLPQAGATSLMVYPGLTSPVSVPTPYYAGDARLEFTSAVDGVMVIHKYGSIADPISAARVVGGAVGGFSPVAGTWSLQGFGLVRSTSGVHVVASRDNASYETVMARWNGTAFTRPVVTRSKGCSSIGHHLSTDATGRVVDAFASSCGIGVATTPAGAGLAGVATWSAGGTLHASPKAITSLLGHGHAAWSVQGDGGAFDKLVVVPIVVPASLVAKARANVAGRIRLTGVQGCMPPSTAKVSLKAKAKRGWKLQKKSLTFDGKRTSRIDGARLAPGSRHKLKAKAVFARGRTTKALSISMTVRACPAG